MTSVSTISRQFVASTSQTAALQARSAVPVFRGPALGSHNDEIYRDLLGLDSAALADLRATGII